MLQETWLAELTQESGNEIYVIHADSLAFMHANQAASDNLDYTDAELQEMTASDLMRDLSPKQLRGFIKQLRDGSADHFKVDTAHKRKDGSSYPVTLRLFYLDLHALPALIAVSSDQHASATRSLIESSEDRLEKIEANLPGLLFQMRQGSSGTPYFCFLSRGSGDLLGMTPKELYARPEKFVNMIIDEDRDSWINSVLKSTQQLSILNWEGRVTIETWRDVKWINVRATPQISGTQGIEWAGLMTNITLSKTLENEISQSRAQLAELTTHLANVKEKERARIERDLHDDLGGNLTALKMMLAQLGKRLPADNPDLAQRANYLDALIDRSIESMHRIACDLRPGILEAGLVPALEWLAQECSTQTTIPFQFSSNVDDIELSQQQAVGLFQIAQEACNNIRKHAQASGVEIRLYDGGDELQLEIIDNGCGMDTAKKPGPKSFGMRSMKERTKTMGGLFHIVSREEKGTIVSVSIPISANILA